MADEIKSSVDVYYGEQLIGIVSHGETGDIDCKGREMLEDIRIKVPYDMKAVKYQDKRFTINKNGKHTMYPDEGYVMGAAIVEVEVPSDNIWLGEFDPDYPYRVGSIVSQNDMVYICIVKPTDNQPPTDTTYWELLGGKIQDEKIVDIITYGRLEFEPDEGYVAVRKLIANVANVTTDATATEEDVVYGKTFWAGGESKAGAMKIVDSSTFSSLVLEKIAEGELEIQYYANKNAYVLNNKDQTRPGTIGTILEPKFIAENIASGVTLFGLEGKHAPIFDGTINIESGFTTISGGYIIDADKAYKALSLLPENRTYIVDFSAGSIINGDQEKKGFISMTFNTDGDKSIIYGRADGSITAFSSTEHMTGGNGFAPYYNAYEEGNGAMVNFYEGTVCHRDFKELFLSIADLDEPAPNLISFTIDGTTYQAEEGMTWAEWCESEYNTNNYKHDSYYVYLSAPEASVALNGSYVNPSSEIIANAVYSTKSNTGGAN